MKIEVKNSLPDIDHQSIPISATAFINRVIDAVGELGVKPMLHGEPTFKTKLGGRYGFAFALDKFDDAFNENLSDGTFRYRHDEVVEILKRLISETPELANKLCWDRGMGVFVYNLFFAKGLEGVE